MSRRIMEGQSAGLGMGGRTLGMVVVRSGAGGGIVVAGTEKTLKKF